MAMPTSPTMLRRHVAAELRRLREHAHRSVADVAGDLGWSESKLSRIETANTGVRNSDLERLLMLYGVEDSERSRLLALAAQARQRGWWEAYGDALPDAYTTYIGFEAEARSIFAYQAQVVYGLLQTAEYASAIMHSTEFFDRPDVIGQRVAVRMARQAVLTREPPIELRVILDEAALRRSIGGPDVLRRQLRRLVEAGERPNTSIQVLTFAVGAHRAHEGSFTLLEFGEDEGADSPMVYCPGLTGGVIRSRPRELRMYWACFEALRSSALSVERSIEFITELANSEALQ